MGAKPKYDYDIADIVNMHNAGMSNTDIAEKFGMSNQNVSYLLRTQGLTRRKGGAIASTIPKREFQVEPEKKRDAEIESIAARNAVNACLVVADREVRLNGAVGSYHVYGKDKAVMISVGDDAVQLSFKNLPAFIDELKAIARNVGGGWNPDAKCGEVTYGAYTAWSPDHQEKQPADSEHRRQAKADPVGAVQGLRKKAACSKSRWRGWANPRFHHPSMSGVCITCRPGIV